MCANMVSEGDAVPSFELPDSPGTLKSSKDFAGKKHVIYFYPKDFTPGCTIQADEFGNLYGEYQRRDIEVIGISPDSVESHENFRKRKKIQYVLMADTQHEVAKTFGVWGTKNVGGKEREGVIRSSFLVGEDGIIFKVYTKVKPTGHASQILDDFDGAASS